MKMRNAWCRLLISILLAAICQAQGKPVNNDSDWWSILKEDSHGPQIKPNNSPLDERSSQILGVTLGEKQFEEVGAKLGKATEIGRGDGATGRHQVCYESAQGLDKIHLVFGFGEVEETFYLFAGGPEWNGSDLCVKSSLITERVATASGLKLGLTRRQTEAILDSPDHVDGDRLFYSREIQKKTSPAEFDQMRTEYPQKLSDKDAHEKFDYYDMTMYVEAHFGNSKLDYLAVSRAE
jgi:hypothetical protein